MRRQIFKFLSYFSFKRFRVLCTRVGWAIDSEYEKRKFKVTGPHFAVHEAFSGKGEQYISVGDGFCAHDFVIMQCFDTYCGKKYTPSLNIGERAYFGDNCHIGCIGTINIGNNLTCGRNVMIIDHNHGYGKLTEAEIHPLDRELAVKGEINIGNNVWLCENSVVLSGVTIGNNVTVGANSVVCSDLPDNCIAAGIPAKIVRMKD